MIVSLRSVLLVAAALTASSVAPAQVQPTTEPLIADGTNAVPAVARVEPITLLDDTLSTPQPAPEAAPVVADTADEEDNLPADLAGMVSELRSSDPGGRELECLAVGIYFESKGEPLRGQLAVGQVIANRAESGRFPGSYCGVIKQRGQFSFVRGGVLPSVPRSSAAWKTAVAVAKIVDRDLHAPTVGKAMFFHATRVHPGWKRSRVATIGNHVFYR